MVVVVDLLKNFGTVSMQKVLASNKILQPLTHETLLRNLTQSKPLTNPFCMNSQFDR